MKDITVKSTIENIEIVTEFVEQQLEATDCPMKAQMLIAIAIDEIFSNIAHYAYTPEVGDVTVSVKVSETPGFIAITFSDSGVPYNPLEQEDPDTELSAEDRKIGGLGVFITKNIIDEADYIYEDGRNKLTIKKNF